ncbi:hypothetical protein K3888_16580 [Dietzia aurantiaca]|uniref:hypothetical protein n=1 Tax=Dietzia aurantiaca TaxID=983873 RepID=UPI001E44C553|nr:hypothetical protein [Dietzia aurantiaca]MCD2264313.1 hypothetical protein [Dietzia aurantiaca]
MRRFDPTPRIRGLVRSYRGRHGRRARVLAALLEGDDDNAAAEVTVHPSQVRLPRTVIYAAARSRGLEPAGGAAALAQRGPWIEPMRFARPAEGSAG